MYICFLICFNDQYFIRKKVSKNSVNFFHYRNKATKPGDKSIQNDDDKYKYFAKDKTPSIIKLFNELKSISSIIKMIIILYIMVKLIKVVNINFIGLIILNIVIAYGPIEKRYPYFLFRSRMFVKQFFEGIIGILCCFNPLYEPAKIK